MAVWWWIKTPKPGPGAAGAPSPKGRPAPGRPARSPLPAACGVAGIIMAIVGEAMWEAEAGPYLVAVGVALIAVGVVTALFARRAP